MSHPFDEPLTPEERAMADRLARLGPRDGPSPALDAKILAAAHAAVAPRRNRRWLALTGVPATLVTGAGMAAVLALAVGVVWQLRPSAPAPRAPRDEAGDFGFVTAEVIERPEPAAAPAPPPPAADAPAPARALQAPAMAKREAAPARAEAVAAKEAPAATAAPAPGQAPEHFLDEAVDPATHSVPETAASGARGDSMPYSAAPAPAAPAAAAVFEGEQRQRAAASAMQRKTAANEAAKQVDENRELRSQAASVVAADRAAAAPADAMAAEDTASGSTLDRIEVTGSRIRMADMPVRDDRELAPAQWLQRIRDRRDDGDLDGARQSLQQFRKSYPRVRLPDDLRALAEPTR
jgi:hypothetical protein